MNLRDIYVFLGPPGAGKGSLSQKCIQELSWRQLSTGSLCRKHIALGTEIGSQIDFAIKSGKLISDDLMIGIVMEWLRENEANSEIILDGFPRTVTQAKALHNCIEQSGNLRLNVTLLKLSDDAVYERIAGRLVCQNSECQSVFSAREGSKYAPQKDMACDFCGAGLTRRSDDKVESIKERLATYHKHAGGLTDFYKSVGQQINSLDVDKPLEEIFKEFLSLKNINKV